MNLTRRGFLAALAAVPVAAGPMSKASLHVGYMEGMAVGNLPPVQYTTWSVPGGSLTIPKNLWTVP